MKLTTNIVLVGNPGSTRPYVVQLIPGSIQTGTFSMYHNDRSEIQNNNAYLFSEQNSNLFRNENDWYHMNWSKSDYTLSKAVVRIYFPQYSVDTFKSGTKYILNLCTYIHGIDVELGSFLFERKDALACTPIRFDGMDEYYEYIDFTIADPYLLHYSTTGDAPVIRQALGKTDTTNSSLLHACLFVVEETDGHYIKSDDWTGGQNSLLIYDPDDLSLHLIYDDANRTLNLTTTYNNEYASTLKEYLQKTYGVNKVAAVIQYIVMDKNDIYYEQSKVVENLNSSTYSFDIDTNEGSVLDPRAKRPSFTFDYNRSYDSEITPYISELPQDNFFYNLPNLLSNSVPGGLYIQSSIMFFKLAAGEDNPFITVFSNKINLTPELLAQMAEGDDSTFPKYINLNDLFMNNVFLKATNKIEQKVTVISPTDSTKNHLIQPVFYQTREVGNVTIHPSVTENISINLDSYKSQVSRFKIQIEGVVFKEIGRTQKGIIFKVIGNMLPKEANDGSLFILNQDDELVTTGKYNYVF